MPTSLIIIVYHATCFIQDLRILPRRPCLNIIPERETGWVLHKYCSDMRKRLGKRAPCKRTARKHASPSYPASSGGLAPGLPISYGRFVSCNSCTVSPGPFSPPLLFPSAPCRFLRCLNNRNAKMIMAIPATAAATPIPAFAPVDRPPLPAAELSLARVRMYRLKSL
jgi:hypothetical protein